MIAFKLSVPLAAVAFLAISAPAHAGDDAPRVLEPRYTLDSNSAPARGKRVRSVALTSSAHFKDCVRLVTADERRACIETPASMAQTPAKPVAEDGREAMLAAMPTVIVSGN